LQVRISDTQTKILEISENECPADAIEKFCQENGLSTDHKKMLLQGVLSAYEHEKPETENIEEDDLEYEDYEVDQGVMIPLNPTNQHTNSESRANSKAQFDLSKSNQKSKQLDPANFESKMSQAEEGMLRFEQQLSKKNLRVKFVESEQKEQIGKAVTLGQQNAQETVFESKGSKNYEIHINSPGKGIQRTNVNIDPNLSRITHENIRTENSEQLISEKDHPMSSLPKSTPNPKEQTKSALSNLDLKNEIVHDTNKLGSRESASNPKRNKFLPNHQISNSNFSVPNNLRHQPLIKPGRSITPEKHADPPSDSSEIQQKLTENVG